MTCGRSSILLAVTAFSFPSFILWFLATNKSESLSLPFFRNMLSSDAQLLGVDGSIWDHTEGWKVLGPFQAGTREIEWGADPLEAYGGFKSLKYHENSSFPSSLCDRGMARWRQVMPKILSPTKVALTIQYDDCVDWDMIRSTYGWAGLQFQVWARGTFTLADPGGEAGGQGNRRQRVAIYLTNAMELWVDGVRHHFGGDIYDYSRAPALVMDLEPGEHRLDVKGVNEIRIFGGQIPPKVEVMVDVRVLETPLTLGLRNAVVPDRVAGRFAGEWIAVHLHNNGDKVISVVSVSTSMNIRPYNFKVDDISDQGAGDTLFVQVDFRVHGEDDIRTVKGSKHIKSYPNASVPHIYTYIHPSGIVSKGVLQPPPSQGTCSGKIPVLLHLHGAGVDVTSPIAGEAYGELPDLCAWIVTPSGGTTWAGDDWHRWGLADAEAAIYAINDWIKYTRWTGLEVDTEKWFVAGHSNGGQGALYTISHRHDRVFGATPLSGYLSIMSYVPYKMWHQADPKIQSILLGSMNSYRADMLAETIVGSRIHLGHGSKDDNVPVYHSRRLFELLKAAQEGDGKELVSYQEFEGKGHWFPGVMTFERIGEFVQSCLRGTIQIPQLPNKFEVVVANPADTGPKAGIVIDQLELPDRFGRVSVEILNGKWNLRTSNIRRWHFSAAPRENMPLPDTLVVDGQTIPDQVSTSGLSFYKIASQWLSTSSSQWKELERHGRQLGAMDAILDMTDGPFLIARSASLPIHAELAISINRNLFQYYGADCEIIEHDDDALSQRHGNVISLGFPKRNLLPPHVNFPIKLDDASGSVVIETSKGQKTYRPAPGLGAIFLIPLSEGRLGIVIWGSDDEGYRRAVRLFPLRTGVGQPDFILVGKESASKGAAGALAMGFMDVHWRIAEEASFFS